MNPTGWHYMKVPVEVFTADGRLHGASLHLPLLQTGWQRNAGTGHLYSHHGTSDHGAFARLFLPEELKVLGVCSEVKPWRTGPKWGPPGWVLRRPSSRCTSKEELRDFPKLPK